MHFSSNILGVVLNCAHSDDSPVGVVEGDMVTHFAGNIERVSYENEEWLMVGSYTQLKLVTWTPL